MAITKAGSGGIRRGPRPASSPRGGERPKTSEKKKTERGSSSAVRDARETAEQQRARRVGQRATGGTTPTRAPTAARAAGAPLDVAGTGPSRTAPGPRRGLSSPAREALAGSGQPLADALAGNDTRRQQLVREAQAGVGEAFGEAIGGRDERRLHEARQSLASAGVAQPSSAQIEQRATQDARAVADTYASDGAQAAAEQLESFAEQRGSEAEVDALIDAARPTIDAIAEHATVHADVLGPQSDAADTLTSLGNVAGGASAQGREAVASSVGDALDRRTGDTGAIAQNVGQALVRSSAPGLANDVAARLERLGRTDLATGVQHSALGEVGRLAHDLARATSAREAASQELATHLAEAPYLDDQERHDYIARYEARHPEIGEARAAEEQAAAALEEALRENAPSLDALAAASPAARGTVIDAYAQLGGTAQAEAASRWSVAQLTSTDSAFRDPRAQERIANDVLGPAAAATFAHAQATAGSPQSALDQLESIYSPLRDLRGRAGTVANGVADLPDLVSALQEGLAGGDGAAFRDRFSSLLDSEGASAGLPGANVFRGAALGFALGNIVEADNASEFVRSALGASTAAADILTATATSEGALARFAQARGGDSLARLGAAAERFSSVVGVVQDGLSFIGSTGEALSDSSAQNVLSAVGDGLGLASSVAGLAGAGVAVAPLALASLAVGVAASVVDQHRSNQEQAEILEQVLQGRGLDEDQLPVIAENLSRRTDIASLQADGGLNDEQLFAVAALPHVGGSSALSLLVEDARRSGLQGEPLQQFLEGVNALGPAGIDAVAQGVRSAAGTSDVGIGATPSEVAALVRDRTRDALSAFAEQYDLPLPPGF